MIWLRYIAGEAKKIPLPHPKIAISILPFCQAFSWNISRGSSKPHERYLRRINLWEQKRTPTMKKKTSRNISSVKEISSTCMILGNNTSKSCAAFHWLVLRRTSMFFWEYSLNRFLDPFRPMNCLDVINLLPQISLCNARHCCARLSGM